MLAFRLIVTAFYSFLVSPLYAGEQITIKSTIENILVAKTSSIPSGPNSEPEGRYKEACGERLVQPKLKSAQMIFDKGWKISSEISYGPYELVSFAGDFDYFHNNCFLVQTNIAIFYKGNLLAIVYTQEENWSDLAGLELLNTSEIAIKDTSIYFESILANIKFSKDEILIDHPHTFSMACGTDGIIPDIKGLEIEEAREMLFDFGWSPRDGKALDDMGDMQLGYSGMRDKTPELKICSGTGISSCLYSYETNNSYLDVTTAGEPEGSVTFVKGVCK